MSLIIANILNLSNLITSTTSVSAASLTLSIPSTPLTLDLAPTTSISGTFGKTDPAKISVKTDNSSGYTLSIKSSNDDKNLVNGDHSISSISESTTEASFKSDPKFKNTWGFSPSKLNSETNSNFLSAPADSQITLDTTSSANAAVANDYYVIIAAKIDQTMPPGNYHNTFQITVLSNDPPYDAIMQNWDGCNNLSEHQTIKLLDIRDRNVYSVSKLKDGQCWMTENLRLGDEELTNRTLTSADSNVSDSFTMPASTITGFTTDSNDTAWVYVDPTHGGYYSWKAATAGTGTSEIASGDAPSSICPKGWRLPTGGPGGELELMANFYGSNSDGAAWKNALLASPAPQFVLSGHAGWSRLQYVNESGNFWSSTAYSSDKTYYLRIYQSPVDTAYFFRKGIGISIRCLVADLRQYSITYNLNSGSGGPSPNPQTGETYAPFVELSNSTPTRSGYEFKGWCDQSTSDETCSGKTYQPGDQYTLSSNSSSVTLYAMWKSTYEEKDLGNLGNMQGFNCDSRLPNMGNYGTVTDTRDSTKYKVAKLKDGKCWMIENLKIVNKTITSSDSNVTSSYTIPASNLSKFNVGSSGWSSNPNNQAAYVDSTYGGYYTWQTATAGTGSSYTSDGQNAPSSICPKSWRLPTGGSSGEFKALNTAYGGSTSSDSHLIASPIPGFLRAGVVNYLDDQLRDQGSYGYYWSSTAYSSTSAYNLNFNSWYVYPASGDSRVLGRSVRCVAG